MRVLLALCLGLLAAVPATASAEVMTPEHVARLRSVGEVALSPDGAQVAYTLSVPRTPFEDEDGPAWSELHVVSVADGVRRPYVTGAVNVSRPAWTPDGGGIAFTAARGDAEEVSLWVIPLTGGEAREILAPPTGVGAYSFSPDGRKVAFLAEEEQPGLEARQEKGFKAEIYEEADPFTRVWIADLDPLHRETVRQARPLGLAGEPSLLRWSPVDDRLALALAPTPLVDDEYMKRRVLVVDATSGEILAAVENPGKLGGLAWSPDGTHLALLSGHDLHDPSAGRLMVVPAAGGELTDVLPELFETGQVESFAWRDDRTLVYTASIGVQSRVGRVDLAGDAATELVATSGPVLDEVEVSEDGRILAFTGEAPDHPDEVFVLGGRHDDPTRLTDSNPWLADIDLGRQEVVRFTARDGLPIEGVLLHAVRRAEGERVPLILYVHGGPESHHSNGWHTRYSDPGHVWAGMGGAVFYTNYRASTGYGVPFSKADHGDFAGAEFDDLVDAVDHLVARGLADSTRVGVTGGSYGGYATGWLCTRYSDRFAAGVMFVGISNNISKFGTSDIPEEMFLVHQRKRTYDHWDFFLERSPIYHAGEAKTPLLILHGKDDPRVNVGQSMELYRHIRTRTDTPVRLVLYPGEKHGNRKAAARYDYNLRMLRWMRHYLMGPGGDKPAPELVYPLAPAAEAAAEAARGPAPAAGKVGASAP